MNLVYVNVINSNRKVIEWIKLLVSAAKNVHLRHISPLHTHVCQIPKYDKDFTSKLNLKIGSYSLPFLINLIHIDAKVRMALVKYGRLRSCVLARFRHFRPSLFALSVPKPVFIFTARYVRLWFPWGVRWRPMDMVSTFYGTTFCVWCEVSSWKETIATANKDLPILVLVQFLEFKILKGFWNSTKIVRNKFK